MCACRSINLKMFLTSLRFTFDSNLSALQGNLQNKEEISLKCSQIEFECKNTFWWRHIPWHFVLPCHANIERINKKWNLWASGNSQNILFLLIFKSYFSYFDGKSRLRSFPHNLFKCQEKEKSECHEREILLIGTAKIIIMRPSRFHA